MILSPRAAGMVYLPPLTTVPAGAVVIDAVWQLAQPIETKRFEPAIASDVAASAVSRGGTLGERMKRTKASTSVRLGLETVAASSGSGTVSNAATELPIVVFSVGWSGLVMPISLT